MSPSSASLHDHVAVRDMPRMTLRAHPVLFKRLEVYRRKTGARSANEALVDLLEKALAAVKL